jgi:hypothetical protein
MRFLRPSTFAAAVLLGMSVSIGAQNGAPLPGSPRAGLPVRDAARPPATGTARVRGRVLTADTGTPLRRTQITIVAAELGVRLVTDTDGDGRYEFADLPAGRYVATAAKGGFVTLQYGQRRPFEPGQPLTVSDGQLLERVDFALPRGGVIAGRIADEFGEPITGVQMEAYRYEYGPGGERSLAYSGGFGLALTDDLGQFRVFGLMPGEYVLDAVPRSRFDEAGGTARAAGDGFAPTYYPGTANPADAQMIAVGLGQEVVLNFSLLTSRLSRIAGTAVDSQGRPAANATVTLRSLRGGQEFTRFGGQTAADGSFTLRNVPPGEHAIDIALKPSGVNLPAESGSTPISIVGEDANGVRITTTPGVTMRGTVVFEGSAPRTGRTAPLRILAVAARRQAPVMVDSDNDNGLVRADGSFELKGLAGVMLFRATTPPLWIIKSVSLNSSDITDTPMELRGANTVTGLRVVFSDRLTTISGTIVGARGEPITEGVVVVHPVDEKDGMTATRYVRTARADQDGGFQIRGLPPARYFVAAVETLERGREWDPEFLKRFRDVARTVTLAEGQTVPLSLPLTPIQ